MKEQLLSIGKMAEINGVSIPTLRLYDKNGLLKPAYIDPESGYRPAAVLYQDFLVRCRIGQVGGKPPEGIWVVLGRVAIGVWMLMFAALGVAVMRADR